MTTAKFYSPTGKAISDVGVKADVQVHQAAKVESENIIGDDNGLRIGIQAARRHMLGNAPTPSNAIGRTELGRANVAGR